jgi:hypothetical protein
MNWYYRPHHRVLIDDLIAFAWSTPMRDLAKKVDLSDVGLKKLLKGYGVPTPPQGHWNRVHAGRPVQSPPKALPRGPGESGRISIDGRLAGHISEAPPFPVEGPFVSARVPEDLAELREQERKAIGKVAAPRRLADERHPGLRDILRAEEKRRIAAYDMPKFAEPFYQRQLRLLCGLSRALERRGHSGRVEDSNGQLRARVLIGDAWLRLSIEVKGKHAKEVLSGYHRPAPSLPVSTPLRLSLGDRLRVELPRCWEDRDDARLEAQLADIAADLIVAGEATFRQSLVEEQERLAEERRRQEEARRKRLAELEAKRLEDLKRSGELLREAENIRALVINVKAAALAGTREIAPDELAQWEEWALDYADRIDPVVSGQVMAHIRAPTLD